MKNNCFALLMFCVLFIGLGGCRSHPSRNTNYTLSLKDSLFWEKKSVDTIIRIPYSFVQLVVNPNNIEPGKTEEKKEGQATVKVEKQPDGNLLISASCDSLQIVVNALEEKLIKVNKQNEQLQEEVKAAPNKWSWFWKGFTSGALIILGITILILIKVFKNK